MPSFIPFPGSQAVGALLPSVAYSLDYQTNLYAAYAPHLLRATYTGKAMQVRNAAGTLLDIGFLSNGELDVPTLLTHVGSGDGSVHTLYDQTGNGRHLTDTAPAAANSFTNGEMQPRICTAGVVERINNRPAIKFRGTDILQFQGASLPAALSAVLLDLPPVSASTVTGMIAGWSHSASPNYHLVDITPSTQTLRWSYGPNAAPGVAGLLTIANGAPNGVPSVHSVRDTGLQARVFTNGSELGLRPGIVRGGTAPDRLQIGARWQSAAISNPFVGLFGGLAIFSADQEVTNVIADFMIRAGLSF